MTVFSYLCQTTRTLQLLQPHSTHARKALNSFFRNESSFVPKRVLIVTKISRYQFERLREPQLSENQLKEKLIKRGSDYDAMINSYMAINNVKNQIIPLLQKMNAEYRIIDRTILDQSHFTWADLVVPIGGDGTFLLASNLMFDNAKLIMGINSCPKKSEGYLLLPERYTKNIPEIFEMLKAGHYNIIKRRRIRVTLKGDKIWEKPFHMHEEGRIFGSESFYTDKVSTDELAKLPKERRLPWLALNEVFMGETLSARTSSLLIKLDEEKKYRKIKGSGLCVSTGTGSTSWYKSINSLNCETVRKILSLVDTKQEFTNAEIERICATFNNNLHYNAEDAKLCYAIRDMITTNTVPVPKDLSPRGFCNKIIVKSQCFDAGLVFDGGIAVHFNFGTTAEIETFPEDSLRTIVLSD